MAMPTATATRQANRARRQSEKTGPKEKTLLSSMVLLGKEEMTEAVRTPRIPRTHIYISVERVSLRQYIYQTQWTSSVVTFSSDPSTLPALPAVVF